jgi:hypothetical protein
MRPWIGKAFGFVASVLFGSSCLADGCDPKFGDQLYDWVSNKSAALSWSLARADYEARTFNYFMVALDQTHGGIQSAADELDRINAHMGSVEARLGSDVFAAVQRESDSQNLLNDLFQIRSTLDHLRHVCAVTTLSFHFLRY